MLFPRDKNFSFWSDVKWSVLRIFIKVTLCILGRFYLGVYIMYVWMDVCINLRTYEFKNN